MLSLLLQYTYFDWVNGADLRYKSKNQKVVVEIKCHAFRDFFSEKRPNGFAKGQWNIQHTQIHSETNNLGINRHKSAHGYILLTALFPATNNEVIMIIWQVIFISGRSNYNQIYQFDTLYVYISLNMKVKEKW